MHSETQHRGFYSKKHKKHEKAGDNSLNEQGNQASER